MIADMFGLEEFFPSLSNKGETSMKNPKLKNFTYSYYLKVTTISGGSSIPAGVKLVLQGAWYCITHDGLVLTSNGKTYNKGWKEKAA